MVIKADELAKSLTDSLGQLGERTVGYARLGNPATHAIIADQARRKIWYYDETNSQAPAVAVVSQNINILSLNNPQLVNTRIRLGYPPYDPKVLYMLGFDTGEGLSAVGGITPTEQYNSKMVYPSVGNITNLRIAPLDPPELTVFVGATPYYDADGNWTLWGGASLDTDDVQALVDALSSGQHQMVLVCLDPAADDLVLITNTAVAGGVANKNNFDWTTIATQMTIDPSYIPAGAFHIYTDQTEVTEDDIYREADPRAIFGKQMGSSSTALSVTDGTTTVDPTTLLHFDPAFFDVTDAGGGEADVTFVGPDTGITQLTGDVTAGPGSGSQAATLATVNGSPGTFAAADITVNGKGLVTAAAAAASTGSGNVVRASAPTITSPVINTGVSGSAIDTDPTLSANSDTLLSTQKATKSYVDAVASGLAVKYSVLAATTAALPANTYANGSSGVGATLTANANGALTVDGQSISATGMRVLVKDESTASHNGIYQCSQVGDGSHPYILTRVTDMDTAAEIPGAFTFVENGTVNDGAGFVVADPGPFTVGTTAITFTQFSGAGEITAGTGLTKSGNTLSLQTPVALANGGTHADLSATGGASQVLKQSSGGADITVGQLASTDISGFNEAVDDRVDALTTVGYGINKTYDDAGNNLKLTNVDSWRPPCRAVANTNVSISSAPGSIDGVALVSGDRVLLTGQTTASQNGPWVFSATSSPMTRPTDYLSGSTILAFAGITYFITEGGATTFKGTLWEITTTGTITIDTTSVTFSNLNYSANRLIGVVLADNGGTAQSTYAKGDIVIASSSTPTLTKLSVGANLKRPVADSSKTTGWDWTYSGSEVLIANTRLGSDGTISLSSFSSAFTHLILILQLRSDRAASTNDGIKITFNGDTGNNYSWAISRINEAGTSAGAQQNGVAAIIPNVCVPAATSASGHFGTMVIHILNYNNISDQRFIQGAFGFPLTASTFNNGQFYGIWNNTANAISSIAIAPSNGTNFKTGSSYELLGVA